MKKLLVSAIENGTVIDHIPSESVFSVVEILGLNTFEGMILVATGLESNKLKYKGIVKVQDRFFEAQEINKIALVAPQATLITIRNFEIVDKKIVEVPDEINDIVKCVNPKCITNNEKIRTRFKVLSKNGIRLQCHYCEKVMDKEDLRIV
jgi:aspartate carbamoyltransferase regulatory subunit